MRSQLCSDDKVQQNNYDALIEENKKLKYENKQMHKFLNEFAENIKEFTLSFLKYNRISNELIEETFLKLKEHSEQLNQASKFLR
jgi:cell division septum initiation protein DivIVA